MPIFFWNYLQHTRQEKPVVPSDLKTAEEFWEDYNVLGVAKLLEGVLDQTDLIQAQCREVKINSVIRGPAFVFNIWGNKIKTGTRLFLILKKVLSKDGQYRLDPANPGKYYTYICMYILFYFL